MELLKVISTISWCTLTLLIRNTLAATLQMEIDKETDENKMAEWLEHYNEQDIHYKYQKFQTLWNYYTNLTQHNRMIMIEAGDEYFQFNTWAIQNMTQFDWENVRNSTIHRKFSVLNRGVRFSPELSKQFSELSSNLTMMYNTAKICNVSHHCLEFEPDIEQKMRTSRDWEELVWLWKGWRDASGEGMRETYEKFVDVQNQAAKLSGYHDRGESWRAWYEDDNFQEDCERLYQQISPLYRELHSYVKHKLQEAYREYADAFPSTGHMPAHLQGNMWSQEWENIYEIVAPYQNATSVDVTDALQEQNYNATAIFKTAEEFFTSLGLEAMTEGFWENSMLEKPEDRDVVCPPSAWDFGDSKDFRVKQCTVPTMRHLIAAHHEMGHVQYYLMYKHQPNIFKRGANPGFHEAVGDVMSLSVSTPHHLYQIGLLKEVANDTEADINFLMLQALKKVAFLPFGYLIDQWRWRVFSGEIDRDHYNSAWWDLRCRYQGLSPPVPRSEEDFDPGAKYHIPNNTPYIRYFVSFIIQFQMHKSLCQAAGHTGPLHLCDIYNSKEAGKKLGDMLRLGMSKPWPDAFEQVTGQRTMDGSALLEYFKPLHDWLKLQNEGNVVGWDQRCPPGSILSGASTVKMSGCNSSLFFCVASIFLGCKWQYTIQLRLSRT